MKTAEIDFSAPVAILKADRTSKWRTANVYKVKYYASFVIIYITNGRPGPGPIYCGDPDQVINHAKSENLALIPMNSKGRKYFDYIINL